MGDENKPRLGRGLAALLGDAAGELSGASSPLGSAVRQWPIEKLRPNLRNPRKSFDEAALQELADSIRTRGVLQPIIVRSCPAEANACEIIAGERRWRAAQKAGLHEVPVIRVEATDRDALELAIIENVQRADLNALEEAEGYNRLLEEFAYTHEHLAAVLGKSRSHVTNSLRLLKLPQGARDLLAQGEITAGHARALLAVPDPDAIARDIVRRGLSVRDVEALGSGSNVLAKRAKSNDPGRREKTPTILELEKAMSDALGMEVSLETKGGQEAGELRIRYRTLEQLDLLCERLR